MASSHWTDPAWQLQRAALLAAHALFCHGRHSGQQNAVWMSAQSEEADDSRSCKQPSAMLAQSLDEAAQRQTHSWDLHRGSQASVLLNIITRQTPSCVNEGKKRHARNGYTSGPYEEKEQVQSQFQSEKCEVDTVQVNTDEAV